MTKNIIRTNLAPQPMGTYSQAWTVTDSKIIFISGQVPVDMDGNITGIGDIALQTHTTLENVKRVLEGAGATLRDVIKLNTYVTDMVEYRNKAQAIRSEYFPKDFPASTLVEVKSLAHSEFMVEIEAIAAVG